MAVLTGSSTPYADRIATLPFSPAELQDLPGVISAPRFATYLQAMGNSREQALELYAWNLDISSALIVPLQVCEVAVRNGISEAIEAVHGANWPWNNGFIRSLPRPKSKFRYNPADDLQLCARRLPTTGKIIAELKFAFGKTSSQPARTAGCGTHFRTFFPGAPLAQSIPVCRAQAYADLQAIRHLRNRIAHHEGDYTKVTYLHAKGERIGNAWALRPSPWLRGLCRGRFCRS
jgi:hypothetical protein